MNTPTTGSVHVLTSPGPAGIAIVRVSGRGADAFIQQHLQATPTGEAGRVLRGRLLDQDGAAIDDLLITVHAPPPSWDVRIHLHGNPWLVRRCVELATACGLAAAAAPLPLWEATDQLEADAYALLPEMLTLRGARWLLAQVERLRAALRALAQRAPDAQARELCRVIARRREIVTWFTQPLRVALVGPPNAGKSTLANALADQAVCIVAPTPGTTRDWVDVPAELNGYPVLWVDTAGLRSSDDELEAAGVARTRQMLATADAVVVVLDLTAPATTEAFVAEYGHLEPACVVLNKSDLAADAEETRRRLPPSWRDRALVAFAAGRQGLDPLGQTLLAAVGRTDDALELPAAYNARLADLLEAAANTHDSNLFTDKMLHIAA